jgi:hypothetical protein
MTVGEETAQSLELEAAGMPSWRKADADCLRRLAELYRQRGGRTILVVDDAK